MKTTFYAVTIAAAFVVLVVPSSSMAARGSPGTPAITVAYAPGANGLDPNDPAWARAPVTVAAFKHINHTETGCGTGGYEDRNVSIGALHDGTRIFIRMDWSDPTADLTVADPNLFADGFGVQIPFGTSGNLQMGSESNPVNIIMWRADWPKPQNIVAGGIGTVQTSPDAASQNIVHSQLWANGFWTVIVSRPMAAASQNQVTFFRGMKTDVAFINLDGSDFERNGHKTISQWLALDVQ